MHAVQKELDEIMLCSVDSETLRKAELSLSLSYGGYRMTSKEYLVFLDGANTLESQHEMTTHDMEAKCNDFIVDNVLKQLDFRRSGLDSRSVPSKSSVKSYRSLRSGGFSSESGRKKTKAEATKARVAVLEQEEELRKKQALLDEEEKLNIAKAERRSQEIEVDLDVLRERKIYAEVEAEANILETISWTGESPRSSLCKDSLLGQSVEDPVERTRKYVHEHSDNGNEATSYGKNFGIQDRYERYMKTDLSPSAPSFNPSKHLDQSVTSELSRYLSKKDLLFSRLSNFDDSPENYSAWKSGFRGILVELNVTPTEELDLLVRWLGPKSTKHAISLRASNISNPSRGLVRLRESSMKGLEARKLEMFPKLNNKDKTKLYELADILAAIESAMENTKCMYWHISTRPLALIRL